TFKLFTSAMALDLGVIQPWSGFDASHPIRYGRFTISDYRGRNRWLSLPEILTNSSNIGAAHMAMAVGVQRHREFLSRLHMGQRLRIELAETAMPLFPSVHAWRDINTMTIGFGHGISVTPMHIITGVSALTNGGTWREPTLLAQAQGAPPRDGTRIISERTSELMRRLMRLVVTDGSGRSAEVPGYFLGGKTGTAQKTGPRGGYLRDKRIAAFVGAFPMNAPRYAVYVMVDEPKPNAQSHGFATAGWVAAPAANYVVSRIAPILGLLPETERAAEIQASIAMPLNGRINLPGAPTAARPATAPAPVPAASGRPGSAASRPAITPPVMPAGPLRQAMAREADLAPR
ncbi:MAG TPA: penicillin-binding transpeptidase domain-containing protein, partial [Roseomonas sp.]